LNAAPEIAQVVLNTSTNLNLTTEDLTAFFINVSDLDGDDVKNITNFFVNGASLTALNMPFEGGSTSGNESINGSTKDYSPFGNNGAVINATFNSTGGEDGFGAYEFDGVSDFIELNNSDAFTFGDEDFTITVRVNMDNIGDFRPIISKNTAGGTGREYFLDYSSSADKFRFFVSQNGTPGGFVSVSSESLGPVSNNTWFYIAAWHDSVANTLNLTVNNASDSVNHSGGVADGNNTLEIGSDKEASRFMEGAIDDVRIYNRVLSTEQIQTLFENTTNIIVSQETATGETWFVNVTPNDRFQDGTSVISNSVTIEAGVPNAPILIEGLEC